MKIFLVPAAIFLALATLVALALKPAQAPATQLAAKTSQVPVRTSADTIYYAPGEAWKSAVYAYILSRGNPTKAIPAGDPYAANELIWVTGSYQLHLIKSNRSNNKDSFLAPGEDNEVLLSCKTAKLAVTIFRNLAKDHKIKTPLRQVVVINQNAAPDTVVTGSVYINRRKLAPKTAKASSEPLGSNRDEALGAVHNPNYPGKQ